MSSRFCPWLGRNQQSGAYVCALAAGVLDRRCASVRNKLVRRGYWLDMNDRSLVMVMMQGIGAHLTNDEKRAHLTDLKREHLVDQVCIQEILPPEQS